MGENSVPLCPKCGTPCRPFHGQWYCDECNAYPFGAPPSGPAPGSLGRALEDLGESIGRGIDGFFKSAQQPTCPTCGGKLEWVEQYERWYCRSCEKYI